MNVDQMMANRMGANAIATPSASEQQSYAAAPQAATSGNFALDLVIALAVFFGIIFAVELAERMWAK